MIKARLQPLFLQHYQITTTMPGTQTSQMEREPATGISVLVVGAGIGGLTFAIESYRKGHDVRVIERSPERQYSGQ